MISRRQYKKLRRIAIFNGTAAKDYNKKKALYDYLKAESYIRIESVRGYSGFVVTEKGHAEMYTYRMEHFRFWFPSIVSLFALAASFLSLATSNPEFWQGVQQVVEHFLAAFRGWI